jgi:hypothetical protein
MRASENQAGIPERYDDRPASEAEISLGTGYFAHERRLHGGNTHMYA